MTSTVETVGVVVPGSPEYRELLASVGENASARDLDDTNPFEQIEALRAPGSARFAYPQASVAAGSPCVSCSG